MVQDFYIFLANITSFALFFLLLHPTLGQCSCFFCTCRLLGAAGKNHRLAGWCSAYAWSPTSAGPSLLLHILFSWSVLPLTLRAAVLELLHTLPQIPTPPPLPSRSPVALSYFINRSHCIRSLLPFTISAHYLHATCHYLLVLLSHWNLYPSYSQISLTTCAQLQLRNLSPSVIPLLGLQPFSLLVLPYQHKNIL